MTLSQKVSYSKLLGSRLESELLRLRLSKDLIIESANDNTVSIRFYDMVYKVDSDIVVDIFNSQPSGYGSQEILYDVINLLEYYSL